MQKTRVLSQVAISVGIIALSAWLSIPCPVPFTMQSVAVMSVAGILGAKKGMLATAIYLFLGCVGVPVFAGFQSGIYVLLGTTGGYLIGFLFLAFITGLGAERRKRNTVLILYMVFGMLVVYVFGTTWYALLYGGSVKAIFMACVIPFLLPDVIKLGLSYVLICRIRKSVLV